MGRFLTIAASEQGLANGLQIDGVAYGSHNSERISVMRRLYVSAKQHPSVSGYVNQNRGEIEGYLNEHAARLLNERASSGRPYKGHDMRWATGQTWGSLGDKFKKSRNKAMGGGAVKKEMQRQRRLGRNMSAGKIRKAIKGNHLVKFGVDPFHR